MENLFLLSKKLEEIIDKNFNYIEDIANDLKYEYGIDSSEELKKAYDILNKDGRLIKIGIIGRVKAGKSSLLNSLFFKGQAVLPKAATPMTAALTILSNSPFFEAEVEFYDKSDVEIIKREHSLYSEKFNKLFEEKLKNLKTRNKQNLPDEELKEKASKATKRELNDEIKLSSSYDQYEKMKKSRFFGKISNIFEKIDAQNLNELKELTFDYVGANGEYMPFTKSIHIKLPLEELENVEVIDTPGINDPVVSREERTRKLLKMCDVIFIVSPSGQFLSSEDKELMDRISTKEGINELYVIGSQADTQLLGDEKEKNKGDLCKVIESITKILENQLVSTVENIKKSNPEVGETFDILFEKNRILITSGIANAINLNFKNREIWDEGMHHVWGNLISNYPDYFSDRDENLSKYSLNQLSNIKAVQAIIDNIKDRKEEILNAKKKKFISDKIATFLSYRNKLIEKIDNKLNLINTTNIDNLIKQKDNILKNKEKLELTITELFEDEYDDIREKITEITNIFLNEEKKKFRDSSSSAKGERLETYTIKSRGAWNTFKGFFGCADYEERTRSIETLKASYISDQIEEIRDAIEYELQSKINKVYKDFKRNLPSKILSSILDMINGSSIDSEMFTLTIKKLTREMKNFEMQEIEIPSDLKQKGTLEGSHCSYYLSRAEDFISGLFDQYKNEIKNILEDIKKYLLENNPLVKITEKMTSDLEKLITEIENKKVTIQIIENIKSELLEVNS